MTAPKSQRSAAAHAEREAREREAQERDARPPLEQVGLRVGDRVRFRPHRGGGRWREGTATGREKDGSISVREDRGAARSMRPERLEVRRRGPRGAMTWRPVTEVAATREQLALWT